MGVRRRRIQRDPATVPDYSGQLADFVSGAGGPDINQYRLRDVIRGAVENLEPHRVPFYLLELAGDFHRYYNKPSNRIISEQRELSLARLFLARLLMDGLGVLPRSPSG